MIYIINTYINNYVYDQKYVITDVYKINYIIYFIFMSENEKNNNDIDILNILSILFKNLILITIITSIFMISVVLYSFISIKLPPKTSFMPNVFSPKSIVILNDANSNNGLSSILGGAGALASLAGISSSGPNDGALAIRIVSTNNFIEKLDKEFNLSIIYNTKDSLHPKTTLRNLIKSKLKLNIDSESGLLEITYTDIDKNLATDIVNKATYLLEEEFLKIDKIRNRSQFALAEENKEKVEKSIEELSLKLINFQKKHNLVDVEVVFKELTEQMSSMQTSLLEKEIDIQSYGMVTNIKDPGLKRLVNEKAAIQTAITKLENGEVGSYPPVKELPSLSLELERLKNEIDVQKAVYKTIIQQYESLKLTAGGTGPTFQVLENAEVPEVKSGPSRGKLCMVVTIVGFFVSIFIVFTKESIISIKNDPAKMKRLKGIPEWEK